MRKIKAKLKYLANTFEIIESGDYVECAISKKKILLILLKIMKKK